MIRRAGVFLALLSALVGTAFAAQVTPSQLSAENANSFPDNNSGAITPAIIRAFHQDVIDSYLPLSNLINCGSGNFVTGFTTTGVPLCQIGTATSMPAYTLLGNAQNYTANGVAIQVTGAFLTAAGIAPNAAGGFPILAAGGYLAAGQFPALTGDISTTAGSLTTTLATVNANVGSWGSATQAPQITVDAKGRVTAAANVTVTPSILSITGLGAGVGTAATIATNANGGFPTVSVSATAPVTPSLFQPWLNTTATPYVWNLWDGASWVALGTLNATTHAFTSPTLNLAATPSGGFGGVSGMLPAANGGAGALTGLMQANSGAPVTASALAVDANGVMSTISLSTAVGNASANLTALNNLIQALGANNGGHIYVPCGNFYFNGTINNNVQNVLVEGCAPSYSSIQPTGSAFTPAQTIATTFTATGAAFSPLYQHITPSSTTTPIFSGGGIRNVNLNGAGIVAIPLYVFDVQRGIYKVKVTGATSISAEFAAGTNTVDCKAVCFVQYADADIDVDTTGTTAKGVVLTGTAASNVAFSKFNIRTLMGSGIGLDCINADNNHIHYVAQITNGGQDVVARGQTASQAPGCSFNVFDQISGATTAPNAIYAEGTDTAGVTAAANNIAWHIDGSNSTPAPTVGTGASWEWYDDYEWHLTNLNIGYKFKLPQFTVAQLGACSAGLSGWMWTATDLTDLALAQGYAQGGGTHVGTVICDSGSSLWRVASYNNVAGGGVYTPTLGCGAGALGAGNTVTGNVTYIGRHLATITIQLNMGAAGIGTCSGALIVSLPSQASSSAWSVYGHNVSSGLPLSGYIGAGATSAVVKSAAGAIPMGNNDVIIVSATYSY